MPIKICHISPASIHSTRWIEAFSNKGYEVSLITDVQTWIAQRPRNVPIYILPRLFKGNAHHQPIPDFVSVARILRQLKPDLVHLHTQHHYAFAAASLHLPFVLHSWGAEVLELSDMSVFRQILAKYAATRAEKIVVDAVVMRTVWTSMGIPQGKVEVIPFGVDLKLFGPNIEAKTTRKELDIGDNEITVVSTRPFFPHYDIECLIRAVPLVVERFSNVKFLVKGTGPLEASIRRLAKRLKIDDVVRFVGPVRYREVPRYLAAADIYVSTSFTDSTSVSLLEAMACALPVVTTDIAGNREWIRNGFNGLLYPSSDHRSLAERIVELIEDQELRRQFGTKSRRIVVERASWDKCVSRMEAIYDDLVREQSRR